LPFSYIHFTLKRVLFNPTAQEESGYAA